MAEDVVAYEKLGAFYLGWPYDPARGKTASSPLLYDWRDLLTYRSVQHRELHRRLGHQAALLVDLALGDGEAPAEAEQSAAADQRRQPGTAQEVDGDRGGHDGLAHGLGSRDLGQGGEDGEVDHVGSHLVLRPRVEEDRIGLLARAQTEGLVEVDRQSGPPFQGRTIIEWSR